MSISFQNPCVYHTLLNNSNDITRSTTHFELWTDFVKWNIAIEISKRYEYLSERTNDSIILFDTAATKITNDLHSTIFNTNIKSLYTSNCGAIEAAKLLLLWL